MGDVPSPEDEVKQPSDQPGAGARSARHDRQIELLCHGPARDRNGRHGMELVPVRALEWRADDQLQPGERRTRRVDGSVDPRRTADSARRRDVHRLDSCVRERRHELSEFYFKRFRPSSTRGRRVGGDQAAEDSLRPAHSLRDAAIPPCRSGQRRGAGADRGGGDGRGEGRQPRSDNYVLAVVLFAFVAVLCRHQHQARRRSLPGRDRRVGLHDLRRDADLARDLPVSISV